AAPSLVVGLDPSEVTDRPAVPAGVEPEAPLADDALPPGVPASWKAPTSGGSTGRPKLIVAPQPGVLETIAGTYERHVRAAYGCGQPDGPRAFTTTFWAVRGVVP